MEYADNLLKMFCNDWTGEARLRLTFDSSSIRCVMSVLCGE